MEKKEVEEELQIKEQSFQSKTNLNESQHSISLFSPKKQKMGFESEANDLDTSINFTSSFSFLSASTVSVSCSSASSFSSSYSKASVTSFHCCNDCSSSISASSPVCVSSPSFSSASSSSPSLFSSASSSLSSSSLSSFSSSAPSSSIFLKEDTKIENEGEEEKEGGVIINAKWGKKNIRFSFSPLDFENFTFLDFKIKIESQLDIPIDRQRFIGISIPCDSCVSSSSQSTSLFRSPRDDDLITSFRFRGTTNSFILMGTPRENAFVDLHNMQCLPHVINDFEMQENDADKEKKNEKLILNELHLTRLKKAIESTEIIIMHPPRKNKKLLVLDLDYTLFDCKGSSSSLNMNLLKRPFLDYFMIEMFKLFDLVIWSQTNWKWIEIKCTELGLLTNHLFHICFVLDRSSMFSVSSLENEGNFCSHEVKALEIIWKKNTNGWGQHNTLHVDDIQKNFAMNPKNGIKVSSFRVGKRSEDMELLLLSKYLHSIFEAEDFSAIDHSNWKLNAKKLLKKQE